MATASLLPGGGLSNPTPTLFSPSRHIPPPEQDPVVTEIYDLIRDIKDPEHPHTLEELNVVSEGCITVNHRAPLASTTTRPPDTRSSGGSIKSNLTLEGDDTEDEELWIRIVFTPTVPHCSLATLIGLCIRVKLERQLEASFKLDIAVSEGTHTIEGDVNKQINDKERVAAAMENPGLREMVEECIKDAEY